MPLLNKAFNFFISDISYNFPVIIIFLFLRNCNIKIKLSRFFTVIYTESVINVSFFVSVF